MLSHELWDLVFSQVKIKIKFPFTKKIQTPLVHLDPDLLSTIDKYLFESKEKNF